MGNYEQLKQSVSDVIKTNGNQEITGSILQNVLLTIISSVGANAAFAGIATPTTNPGTPDGLVFYLASESGTYTNFNAIELQDGLSVLIWNGSWSSQQIFSVDDVPTAGSDNLVKSGGVYTKIKALEDAETDPRFSYAVNCGKKNTLLNNNGNEIQFNNYNTYYFNVSDYAGGKILISAYGLADPNGDWSLITCIKNDGTKDVIINRIGNYVQRYVYNVPENAKEIGISSDNGNITVLTYDKKIIKPIDYKTIYDVENSIADLQRRFLSPNGSTAVITTGNLLNETTFTDGKCLNKKDGSEVLFSKYSYTDYILVQSIKKLICYNIPENGGCFYDINKSFIIGFGNNPSIRNAVIDVPENAAFVRFNVGINDRNNGTAYLIDYDNKDVIIQYPWLMSTIGYEAIQIGVGAGWLSDDGTIKSSPTNGKYYKFDLPIGSSSVIVSNTTGITKNAGWSAFWFVDENGDYIESVSIDTTELVYKNYKKIIPANAKQIWVSSGMPKVVVGNDGNIISDIYSKIENASNLNHFFGKKIVWLGTSIPYGQTSEAGVSNPMPTPYPVIVGNNLKANVVNVARPGMAIETEPDGGRKTYGSLSLSIAELREQGYPTSPYQSYENAMLGQDADLYVFDCEPNNSNGDVSIIEEFDFYNWKYKDDSTFESHRDNYIGAFLFLLDKLWAEKPDAKVVMVSEFGYYTEEKWGETYPIREASLAIAKKLNIHVINLWDKLFYNKQNLSIYINTDNVHPKVAAHIRMGAILTNELLLID